MGAPSASRPAPPVLSTPPKDFIDFKGQQGETPMIDLSAGPLHAVKLQQVNDEETSFAFIKDPILPDKRSEVPKCVSFVQHQVEETNLQLQHQVQFQEHQTRQLLEQQQKQIQQLQWQWAEQQQRQQEQQRQQQRQQRQQHEQQKHHLHHQQQPMLTPMQIPPPMALPIPTSSQAVAIPDLHSILPSPPSAMKGSLGSCIQPVQVAVPAKATKLYDQRYSQKPLHAEPVPVLSPQSLSEKIKVQLLAEQVQQNVALKKQMDQMKTQLDMQQMQMQMQMMQMQSMTSIHFGP